MSEFESLNHSFIDKNRHVKLNLLSEFELLLNQVSSSVPDCQHEDFKHFLRVHSNLFNQNIHNTPDYTYKVLQKLASDPDLVVLSGDKDSSVVIMQRADYVNKLETMIEEGITNGKYVVTDDNTLKVLKSFQNFLTRNFKSSLPLDKIKPTSNQPAFLYGTAKTHKFQNPEQITKDNLKLRPIVSTCGTFYYETAKFLASYLLPLTENEYSIKTTTDFAERLTNRTVDDDEVLVSYDVSSLFTEVPLDETIDHIIYEIYTNNKLPQLSSKLLFRRLLCNVTKNTVFSFNDKLYKQIDGCGMGNPLSPVLANIFMAKLEADVVRPFNPPFYDRYVDDCFSKKKKGEPDALLERLNRYHPNIVFTVEENPDHFLDTAFSYTNKFNCSVFKKPGKLPTHWKSEVPTKWKRNCITGALHRAKRISTDFEKDIKTLETSFIEAGYPKRFISHTINNFLTDSSQDDNIIPDFLFEERKKVFIKLPFCGKNEKLSKTFIAKLNKFTNFNFIFVILWQTRRIKSLFNNKDKNTHRSKVVYKGDCSCGVDYIGETVRNLEVRIAEHSNPAHTSEPAKHLRENPSHSFTWRVLSSAQTFHKRRIKDENRRAYHCKHAFSCTAQLKEFKHVPEKMASRPQEYITLDGRVSNDIPEGYHGIALVYRNKRIDLGSIHYKCKTNMSIPHKNIGPIWIVLLFMVLGISMPKRAEEYVMQRQEDYEKEISKNLTLSSAEAVLLVWSRKAQCMK
ncbi:hypothetical protein ACROYT_G015213 [Oculina patagonica]